MIRLYVHRFTKRYTDYGEYLDTVEGLAWSNGNDPSLSWGFEEGNFEALFAGYQAKMADAAGVLELVRGVDIARTVDLNPHGLI